MLYPLSYSPIVGSFLIVAGKQRRGEYSRRNQRSNLFFRQASKINIAERPSNSASFSYVKPRNRENQRQSRRSALRGSFVQSSRIDIGKENPKSSRTTHSFGSLNRTKSLHCTNLAITLLFARIWQRGSSLNCCNHLAYGRDRGGVPISENLFQASARSFVRSSAMTSFSAAAQFSSAV
jgi:hypothetical protein